MIKLLDLLMEYDKTDWEFGFERQFKFDQNSTTNEGRFRLFPPEDIQDNSYFRTTKHPITKDAVDGISYVMGKQKGNGKLTIQAIRFNKNLWTEEQAREWFNDNKSKFHFHVAID